MSLALLLGSSAFAQNEAEALFNARCARCHGPDGAGKTIAGRRMHIPDLRSPQVQKLTDEELFETVAHGTRHHNYPHVFKSLGLGDGQIRQLVKYVRELAKSRASKKKQ